MQIIIPKHVAIIPDGNRRWAKEKGLPTKVGHQKGAEVAVELVKSSRELGIHTLTLWAFSTENWSRNQEEVDFLMKLFSDLIAKFGKDALENEVRLIHIGRKDRLSQELFTKINELEEKTKNYTNHVLNIALDYGGRDELERAAEKMKKANGSDLEQYLDTAGQPYPNPDLIIRTSGELRTSGLLIWQAAYAEFYSEKTHFPEFNKEKFKKALAEFSLRERRFGGS